MTLLLTLTKNMILVLFFLALIEKKEEEGQEKERSLLNGEPRGPVESVPGAGGEAENRVV